MKTIGPFAFLILIFISLMVVINLTRPPLPIDETRYLTVAWEYFSRHDWILPTLNFEPYHHKPPMLFWLINVMWHFFGTTDIWAARLVTLIGSLGTLFFTHKIARLLWPERPQTADITILMIAATPFFVLYSSLIMFDTLLSVSVLCGIYAILKFYTGGSRWNFMLLALALACGAIIKGPVVLLHIIPVMILFPIIQRPFKISRSVWYQGLIFAGVIGTALALTWAIPAAKIGGPEYEKMIFWGQSAGRMVQSFDHARPFWFYLVTLPLILLPWAFIPGFWRKGEQPEQTKTWQKRFILCWILPVFTAFMFISGKQVHYLMPILPGIFMLIAHYLTSRGIFNRISSKHLYIWATIPVIVTLIATITIEIYAHHFNLNLTDHLMIQLQETREHFIIIAILIVIGIGYWIKRNHLSSIETLRPIVVANMIAIAALHFSVAPMLKKYYDLSEIARVVNRAAENNQSIAVARAWHGEIGYLARLNKGVEIIEPSAMKSWLTRHPRGIIILRHDTDDQPVGYKIVYTSPYRSPSKSISVLSK